MKIMATTVFANGKVSKHPAVIYEGEWPSYTDFCKIMVHVHTRYSERTSRYSRIDVLLDDGTVITEQDAIRYLKGVREQKIKDREKKADEDFIKSMGEYFDDPITEHFSTFKATVMFISDNLKLEIKKQDLCLVLSGKVINKLRLSDAINAVRWHDEDDEEEEDGS